MSETHLNITKALNHILLELSLSELYKIMCLSLVILYYDPPRLGFYLCLCAVT